MVNGTALGRVSRLSGSPAGAAYVRCAVASRVGRHAVRLVACCSLVAAVLVVLVPPAPFGLPPAAASFVPFVTTGGAAGVPNGGHSCALMPDQSVWCWGMNSNGQLGTTQVGLQGHSPVPVPVQGLPAAIDVSAGANFTCAVDTSNNVWCWGDNSFGELGDGTFTQSSVPVEVSGGLKASQVSAGDDQACAVTLNRTVKCWGDGQEGALGDGSNSDSTKPVLVHGLTLISAVATGSGHSCSLGLNGGVECWGSNFAGELGDGTTTSTNVPVAVSGLDAGVLQISAGGFDTCAVLHGGDLQCWGYDADGELGDGNQTAQDVPTQVSGLDSDVQQVSVGEEQTCAITEDPSLTAMCWGDPAHGDLGNGMFGGLPDPYPTAVFGMTAPASGGGVRVPDQIASGFNHTCLVLGSGKVTCWGSGDFGELGDGSTEDEAVPTPTIGLPEAAGSSAAVAQSSGTACAVTGTLRADCWGIWTGNGDTTIPQTSAMPAANLAAGDVAQVATSEAGGCALTVHQTVKCWGANADGNVGDGTTVNRPDPVDVAGIAGIQGVSEGTATCAWDTGTAWCWGANGDGELGDGTDSGPQTCSAQACSTKPVEVQSLPPSPAPTSPIVQVSGGSVSTCALLHNGAVYCWGRGAEGELGDNATSSSSVPVRVANLSDAVQISVGGAFACALTVVGDVVCWGANTDGGLGNNNAPNDSDVPVQVSGLTNGVTAISAGAYHACAVLLSGQVDCWGDNDNGQLGDGTDTGPQTCGGTPCSETPVGVSGGFQSDGSSVSAGGYSTCALSSTEVAECWGWNLHGQLGNGTTTDSDVPVHVDGL